MPVTRRTRPAKDDVANRAIGARLKNLRYLYGYVADDVARSLGHTPQWLYEIEGGRSQLLYRDAVAIAKIYGVPVERFAHPDAVYSIFRAPESMEDWRTMYKDDEARANAHFSIDQLFKDKRKV